MILGATRAASIVPLNGDYARNDYVIYIALYRMHYLNDAINSAIELYAPRSAEYRGIMNEDDVDP